MQKRLHFAYFIITFILLIFVFLLLLTVTNFIPKQAFFKNFKVSVSQVAEYETMNQKTPQLFKHYQLDYHTDAIMLDNAYFVDAEKPIKAALSCPSFGGSLDNLYSVMMNPDIAPSKTYSRYWHGYLIMLRPMLIFLDYLRLAS